MLDFERALRFVLAREGGYVNDPKDPGGETKYGISKRAYPHLDISALTERDAATIYRQDYWIKAGADLLPWPMSLIVFDSAVQHGVRRAHSFLDQSNDWHGYLANRRAFYQRLARRKPVLGRFLKGWLNRLAALELAAHEELNEEPIA